MDVNEILKKSGAFIKDDHFVYKAGTHGEVYINKEAFSFLGANALVALIEQMVSNALGQGFSAGFSKRIGVVGPAMGAVGFSLTVAAAFERAIPGVTFFPARTELEVDSSGKKVHVIPAKLKSLYDGASFIISEDITNNGTTIKEVKTLFEGELGSDVVAATCFVDRGGQTAHSLDISQYYPLLSVNMAQHDPREGCPICKSGRPINTVLGKGERWVKIFGQPPYDEGTDFSAFWE